jgi:glycosyltransferase involved in cell wall biosynthesis
MSTQPLISCIMPTRDRRRYVPQAIECWQRQTYEPKELVVVDNGDDAVHDLIPPGVTYFRIPEEEGKLTTGAMRNRAIQVSGGSMIAHWDDDDWSHPNRLFEEYRMMQQMCVALVGYNEMYFMAEDTEEAWLYKNTDLYAIGTSLLYTRHYWRSHPFPDLAVCEDTEFQNDAQWRRAMTCRAAQDRMVARVHGANTSEKRQWMIPPMWQPVSYEHVRSFLLCTR